MSPEARAGVARAIATAGVVVALDQATKQAVVRSLARGEHANVFLGLDLTNTRNKGVAFGALEGGGLIIAVLIGVALALVLGYFAVNAGRPWLWLPVGLLLGGALGNLADRARDGRGDRLHRPDRLARLQPGGRDDRGRGAGAPLPARGRT